jgi:hypothetical protein
VLLGQLGGAGDDHDDTQGSRHTSLAYHTRPHQRPIGVGHTRSRPAAVTDYEDHGLAVTIHTATPRLPSSISEPKFRGQNDGADEPAQHLRVVAISSDDQTIGGRHWMCGSTLVRVALRHNTFPHT